MCYRPITIRNPRIDFRSSVDPLHLTVPCGQCLECRKGKRDDWFVRLYYEWQHYKEHGCVAFPTFTFNDDNLPVLDLSDSRFDALDIYGKRPDISCIPSFDKKMLQKTIKKLRTRLSRQGLSNFKYFVVCERGSDPSCTHRPHYHMILFFDSKMSESSLKLELEYAWSYKSDNVPQGFKDLAARYFELHPEQHIFAPFSTKKLGFYKYVASRNNYGKINYFCKRGNVSFGTDSNGVSSAFINSSDSLSYVTKYLHKSPEFLNDPNIVAVSRWLDNVPSSSDSSLEGKEFKYIRGLIDEVRNIYPFTLSSNNIGIDLFNDLDIRSQLSLKHDQLLKNELLPNHIIVEGNYYAIPTYITDKLFYSSSDVFRYEDLTSPDGQYIVNCKKTKKRFYTELGKKVISMRLDLKAHDMAQKFQLYFNPQFLNLIKDFSYNEKTSDIFSDVKQFNLTAYETLKIDFLLCAYYKLCAQNVLLLDDVDYTNYSIDNFINSFRSMYMFKLHSFGDVHDSFDPPTKDYQTYMFLNNHSTYNSLPLFKDYDYFLSFIDKIKHYISLCRLKSKQHSEDISQKLSNYFNQIKYGV